MEDVEKPPFQEKTYNGGRLYTGGVRGHKGGGRWPNKLRLLINRIGEKGLIQIEKNLDNGVIADELALRTIIGTIGYVLPKKVELEHLSAERLEEVAEVLGGYFVGREDEFRECFDQMASILLPQSTALVNADCEEQEEQDEG